MTTVFKASLEMNPKDFKHFLNNRCLTFKKVTKSNFEEQNSLVMEYTKRFGCTLEDVLNTESLKEEIPVEDRYDEEYYRVLEIMEKEENEYVEYEYDTCENSESEDSDFEIDTEWCTY